MYARQHIQAHPDADARLAQRHPLVQGVCVAEDGTEGVEPVVLCLSSFPSPPPLLRCLSSFAALPPLRTCTRALVLALLGPDDYEPRLPHPVWLQPLLEELLPRRARVPEVPCAEKHVEVGAGPGGRDLDDAEEHALDGGCRVASRVQQPHPHRLAPLEGVGAAAHRFQRVHVHLARAQHCFEVRRRLPQAHLHSEVLVSERERALVVHGHEPPAACHFCLLFPIAMHQLHEAIRQLVPGSDLDPDHLDPKATVRSVLVCRCDTASAHPC
mmetsp:Transcript_46939/g.110527  ORF Transcript_46939/g.110527 Transcript_46939/m.110527 type:complete len:270 (-) Transcript_46939:151-960(-)